MNEKPVMLPPGRPKLVTKRTAAVTIPTRPSRSANVQRQKVSVAALIMRAVARPYQTGSDEAA
jgi:hypothetical protein